ncbi:MAG: PilZ domain-containing protein [Magnetococcales bacterium]|nr:PilZ domain-containing protein [Magnetococcales bacterium]
MGKVYYKALEIKKFLQRAFWESTLIEVHLDQDEKMYGARFLDVPGGTEKKSDPNDDILTELASGLYDELGSAPEGASADEAELEAHADETDITISPLEPTDGNIKIRRSKQVTLRFHQGVDAFECKVSFKKVTVVDGAQGIVLTRPQVVTSSAWRAQERVEVPEGVVVPLGIQKRGIESFKGRLVDISPGGLSFFCEVKDGTVESGDKLSVIIGGEWGPVSTFGSVCRVTKVRDPNDMQKTLIQYGVKFQMLSVSDAMTVDRLVKSFQGK